MQKRKQGIYAKYIKRLLDIICALLAIIVFCWLYIIVAVLVWIKLGRPVLFKQARPGKDEKIFNMYKFRTMTDARDENGNLLPDDVRLTKFGKLLRSTSLDELPEAFNILKGDMSIVGPRPLMARYLPYYTEEEKKRHLVRPGLTGHAQVHGRNAVSWDERFKYDIEYVNNTTFITDLKILYETVKIVISRKGISIDDLENLDSYRNRKNLEKKEVIT